MLSAALPALEAARLALADLDKNDITEIRSFATPPEAVQVYTDTGEGERDRRYSSIFGMTFGYKISTETSKLQFIQ